MGKTGLRAVSLSSFLPLMRVYLMILPPALISQITAERQILLLLSLALLLVLLLIGVLQGQKLGLWQTIEGLAGSCIISLRLVYLNGLC